MLWLLSFNAFWRRILQNLLLSYLKLSAETPPYEAKKLVHTIINLLTRQKKRTVDKD